MKQVRLHPSGVLMRFVDKDMVGVLLQHLIETVSEQCELTFPMAPSPSTISQAMPGSGWYAIYSTDIKTSVVVTQYDSGTYARFVLNGLHCDAVFVVYRVETGRIPLDSLVPDVTMDDEPEIVAQAIELPIAQAELASQELQAAAESLFKIKSHQLRSSSQDWTQEQLERLKLAVEKYGRRWKLIVSKFDFGELSSQDLCSKWNELLKSSSVGGRQGKAVKASGSSTIITENSSGQHLGDDYTLPFHH